jgi:hypothetical protein
MDLPASQKITIPFFCRKALIHYLCRLKYLTTNNRMTL